jgi:hypothetical protein
MAKANLPQAIQLQSLNFQPPYPANLENPIVCSGFLAMR